MALSEFNKDYITIWNQAVAGIYALVGFAGVYTVVAMIDTCNNIKKLSPNSNMSCGIDGDAIVPVIVYVLMLLGGLATFLYTRRYFRGVGLKTPAGIISSFSLTGVGGYMIYRIISSMIETSNKTGKSTFDILSSLLGNGSVITWVILVSIIISFITAVLSIVIVFTTRPEIRQSSADSEDMASTPEKASAPAKKKDLPPMLSAEPESANPTVGHDGTITPDGSAVKQEEAAPAPASEPVPATTQSASTQPADPAAEPGKL